MFIKLGPMFIEISIMFVQFNLFIDSHGQNSIPDGFHIYIYIYFFIISVICHHLEAWFDGFGSMTYQIRFDQALGPQQTIRFIEDSGY